MAQIASGINACCHCHVPYDVINKRLSASFGPYTAENAERFPVLLNDIVFIDISAFAAKGFLYIIVLYEQSDHIVVKLYSF